MASQVEEFLTPETEERDEDQMFRRSGEGLSVYYAREEGDWVDE